ATKHQLLFIRKGGIILHQIFKKPYRALIFMFDDSTIQQIMSEYPTLLGIDFPKSINFYNHPPIIELKSNPHLQSIYFSALEYLKNPAPESTISLEIKFKELIINVVREKESNRSEEHTSELQSRENLVCRLL